MKKINYLIIVLIISSIIMGYYGLKSEKIKSNIQIEKTNEIQSTNQALKEVPAKYPKKIVDENYNKTYILNNTGNGYDVKK